MYKKLLSQYSNSLFNFLADNYVFNFPTSGVREGAPIGNVLARDADQGLNSLIRYVDDIMILVCCRKRFNIE